MAGDCTITVVPFTCSTGGGNQTISLTGVGTPKAVLFIVGNCTAADTDTAGAVSCVGFSDGTASRDGCACAMAEDGQARSDTKRLDNDTQCINIFTDAGTSDGAASWSSWATDGVTINWGTTPGAAYLGVAVFFSGADVSAYTDYVSNSGGDLDVTSPGFEPDLVLVAASRGASGTSPGASAGIGWGYARNTGAGTEQSSLNAFSLDNAADVAAANYHTNAYALRNLSDTTLFGGWDVGSWDANGFTLAQVGGSGTAGFYLALKFSGCSLSSGVRTTSTGTGTEAITTPGFTPQFLMTFAPFSQASEWGAIDTGGTPVIGVGLGVCDDTNARALVWKDEDAAATSDCSTEFFTAAIATSDHTDGDNYEADLSSFDASGWTWNWTDITSPVRQYAWLAIEENQAAGGTTVAQTSSPVLALTPFNATIDYDVTVAQVASPVLTLTPNNATVNLDVTVAQVASPVLTLAPLAATIDYDVTVAQVASPVLTLTPLNATITTDADTLISQVASPVLTLTPQNATVDFDVIVAQTVGVDPTRALTPLNATVDYDIIVAQTSSPVLTLSPLNGTIVFDTIVEQVTSPVLALTPLNGTVSLALTIAQTSSPVLTLTPNNGAVSFDAIVAQVSSPVLSFTPLNATISTGADTVITQTSSPVLTLTPLDATVDYDVIVAQVALATLTLTPFDARLIVPCTQRKFLVDINLQGNDLLDAGAVYFGVKDAAGSWRMIPSGSNMVLQRHESGSYVTKATWTP